jgi:hypothetical protein
VSGRNLAVWMIGATARRSGEHSGEMEAAETKAFDTTDLRVASGRKKEAGLDGPANSEPNIPLEKQEIQSRDGCGAYGCSPPRKARTISSRLNRPDRGGDSNGVELIDACGNLAQN